MPSSLQRSMSLAAEKGASTWLSTLPIEEHGFALHKGGFRDALCLRYGWQPTLLPSQCVCGKKFYVEHALTCPRGGFPSVRDNEVRDITADLLTEVCHGVGTEPHLQPVTEEQFAHRTANKEGARLDILAENFWSRDRQRSFFDVRVFNPLSQTYQNTSLAQCFRKNELEKRRAYDEHIRKIEHSSFSPLVFSNGYNSVLKACSNDRKEKDLQQDHTLVEMPPQLLPSTLSHYVSQRKQIIPPPTLVNTIDLACSEGQVPSSH